MKLLIKETKSYSSLHYLPMNREVNSKHVQSMVDSINIMGIIRPVVLCETNCVDGIKKKYILDGQHLVNACQRLNIAIPYVIIPVNDELDIVHKMGMLNSTSKSWTLKDYVNAYKMFKPDYMTLFKYHNLYNLSYSELAVILGLKTSYDSGKGIKPLKEGKFVINNPDGELACKNLSEMVTLLGGNIIPQVRRVFVRLYATNSFKFNHGSTFTAIKSNLDSLAVITKEYDLEEFLLSKIIKF